MKKTNIKSLVLAVADAVLGLVTLVTLTISHSVHSQGIALDAGRTLEARDIRKNNSPFTSVWLRRSLELVPKHSLHHEEIIFCESLSPCDEPSHPRLEMKSTNEALIFVKQRDPILVDLNQTGEQNGGPNPIPLPLTTHLYVGKRL